MRGCALLVGCALTACGGSGVDVEIFAPDGVHLDHIELWVAYDRCDDCPAGVAWQSDGERAPGDIYFLRDEAAIVAEPHGDRWVLHLEAVTGDREPGWIAVVGYTGDSASAIEVLRDVRIPATTVAIWRVQLRAADPATTDLATPPASGNRDVRAHAWARPPTPALARPTGCLAYQAWDGEQWNTEYFVPPSDPDCDGIPVDQECSEFWYQYQPLGGRCVTDTGPTVVGACVVGVSTCADGVSSDTACHEAPPQLVTCLPDSACEKCSDMIPADDCIPSAIESGVGSDTTLHYHCAFDASAEGTPCQVEKAILHLPRSTDTTAATCATPTLRYLDQPFGAPQPQLVFGTAPTQATFALGATLEPCTYELTWTTGNQEAFADPVTFLVDMPYTNGLHALYPVQIMPTGQTIDCAMLAPPHDCTLGGPSDDGVTRCSTY